jgi:hypothetical protein
MFINGKIGDGSGTQHCRGFDTPHQPHTCKAGKLTVNCLHGGPYGRSYFSRTSLRDRICIASRGYRRCSSSRTAAREQRSLSRHTATHRVALLRRSAECTQRSRRQPHGQSRKHRDESHAPHRVIVRPRTLCRPVRKWRYNRSPAWPASARSIRTAIQARSPFAAERPLRPANGNHKNF